MAMRPIHVKIARIITGSVLTVLASVVVMRAISFGIIHGGRGHSYSLADNPVFFYCMVGGHVVMMVLGVLIFVQGWRDSGD
jgi:acyl CoA:acetate/3-ketoacid CoA transferase beta subunit